MGHFGMSAEMAKGNHFVIGMTDRFFMLTRAVPVAKTTDLYRALTFTNSVNKAYGIPNFHLTNNGSHFMSKVFEALCSFLNVTESKDNSLRSAKQTVKPSGTTKQ